MKINTGIQNKKTSAFTLIEILIVVSIIGVMSTALIPRVTGAQSRARNIARMSMLAQVSTAVTSFDGTNHYLPNSLSQLVGDYVSSLPTDPRNYSACNSSATSGGNFGYLTYNEGGSNADEEGYILLSQIENGGVGIGYNQIYVLDGDNPCDTSTDPWYRIANSVCTSKPGRTSNNAGRSNLALFDSVLQRAIYPRTPKAYAQTSSPTCNGLVADIWVNSSTNRIVGGPNSGQTYNGTNLVGGSWNTAGYVVVGTNGNDTINSQYLNGNDTICGLGGNDIIYGQQGTNRIDAGSGDDYVYGGQHNDTIYGGDGVDRLWGAQGDDTIYGGDGDDYIYGESQNDTLYGDGGADYIYGADGTELIYGGDGDDYIEGGSQSDIIYGGDGDDFIKGDSDNDRLSGGDGNDSLDGGSNNDILYGGDGDDILIGQDGDEWISGGSGNDSFQGGYGNNNCSDFGAGDTVVDPNPPRNTSCNTSAGSNGGRNGFDITSCTSSSFDPACNSDYDNDGISNSSEGSVLDSDAVGSFPADGILDWQDSNTVDTDGDGVVNQQDPNNTCPCIPNLGIGCDQVACSPNYIPPVNNNNSPPPSPTNTSLNLPIVGVNCAEITSLPSNLRAYYVIIQPK